MSILILLQVFSFSEKALSFISVEMLIFVQYYLNNKIFDFWKYNLKNFHSSNFCIPLTAFNFLYYICVFQTCNFPTKFHRIYLLIIETEVLFIILHCIMYNKTSWIEQMIFFELLSWDVVKKSPNTVLLLWKKKKGRKHNVYKVG